MVVDNVKMYREGDRHFTEVTVTYPEAHGFTAGRTTYNGSMTFYKVLSGIQGGASYAVNSGNRDFTDGGVITDLRAREIPEEVLELMGDK